MRAAQTTKLRQLTLASLQRGEAASLVTVALRMKRLLLWPLGATQLYPIALVSGLMGHFTPI
ncbi:hypothetical protein AB7M42_007678 [Bradyrhizobium diazoefficiens]|jgi:hypothetical protein|uniref:Uncharacterized protein n=3 Tax=Bradyrhizobium TaxID=374 RepID=A0A1L3FPF4_BRAJP|nr:hypothetical protein BKD09_43245 [Bradyrhizobium japonicum]AWL91518.1 hypothetical protein CIT37_04040 [Bradyrhizobium ottawaense]MCS3899477.1 hypothetical protein [Bradyrhizobium japonicum USDA 38]MCS3933121.1 hypothetical protein [Bradyrhizobium elkanii]TWH92880.1 hypothetical protein IQ17_07116 [Bradyrhizobium daqingense]